MYFEEALYNTLHPECPPLDPGAKPLLTAGTTLKATTKSTVLEIQAIGEQTRHYRWKSVGDKNWSDEVVKLKGGDGGNLNYPGNRSEDLLTFFGLKRNVMAFEGEQDCKDAEELTYELMNYGLTHGAVYSQSGLLVGCRPKTPDFLVIQLKLRGQTPKDLPGANDSAIIITSSK